MLNQYRLHKLSLAISLGLLASSVNVSAAQEEQSEIEEVVAVGTRLQGSAAAVIEERKNQAFVADILGAEQLSRTGDSDAASALRRVTGLTLVDGKFIYVRGLGERYSSARLNGAYIPSPDLTRNVVPLDIFPASIIESMAVQKAYSPNMPAAFGGGNIDIRTKAIPSEFTAGFEVGAAKDTSAGKGFTYKGDDDGIPTSINAAIVQYRGDFSISNMIARGNLVDNENGTRSEQAIAMNNQLLKSLPRDFALKEESLDPSWDVKGHIGNSVEEDLLGGKLGFLLSGEYANSWDAAERKTAVIAQEIQDNCATTLNSAQDVSRSCFNTVKHSTTTTENERYNATLNLGYQLDTHKVSLMNLYLRDNEDETKVSSSESPAGSTVFTIVNDGRANRDHEFNLEQRTLTVTQLIGQHTFLDWWGIGADWQYTRSKAETDIPTNVEFKFRDNYDTSGKYLNSQITGDDNRAIYSYTNMEDRVNSYGGNMTLPLTFEGLEIELKGGFDASDRARVYNTSSFAVNNGTGLALGVATDPLLASSYLTNDFIDGQRILVDFNEPSAPDADDYLAAQKINAGYASFDVIYDNFIRVSGGVRYEEFKQSSIGTSSLIFDKDDLDIYYNPEKIESGSIHQSDYFPALSLTYLGGEDYQVRLGYGETIVRPDLREVVPVSYFDPLTDIRTFGRVGLKSSPIKNYDLRFEHYGQSGDSYSIAAFYKDISQPIETVLRIGDEDYSASFINGETAKVYGVEAEWLKDLTFVTEGLFTSGNITLSDSEATIDPSLAGNLTNPTKRMTGHSKYVVNLQLNYDSVDGMHSSSLVYNMFGERILAAGVGGPDDAYEQPFHSLDLVYTWYPDFNSNVKFKVKNLMNEDQEVTQSDVVVRSKEVGMTFDISYSYSF
ncbi:TonB-dependent receptor plug domain-containing protein [Pseudoalteromonas tunicata]|uniref:TonB-dependent receptor plug domain-containing protein n=1 Tax=Pseudoalteromonas tunicata TaxID=314281 RepID=UPI00273E1D0E|nr:TonB-dependent receptor plug domain-containing protein [Pseudoalteromonas tunicata]MDP4982942.1 TonB-dependent receptor plug domain-containing protein [Pseudoalteromonas tunicata]